MNIKEMETSKPKKEISSVLYIVLMAIVYIIALAI